MILRKLWPNRSRVAIVAVMIALYFFSFFQRIAIPGTIFDELQSDFCTSAARIALLGAIAFYVYSSMQLCAGIFVDRFGAARILLVGSAVLATGSILFPLSSSIYVLYTARVLTSLGASLIFVSMGKEIDFLFGEKNFAVVLSVVLSLGCVGGLVGTWPLERAVSVFGWRCSLLTIGVFCGAVVLIAGWVFHKTRRTAKTDGSFSWSKLKQILVNKSAIPLECSGSITFAIYLLFQAVIGKKLLQDCYGFASQQAAFYTFAMMVSNITVVACSGFISRMLSNRRKPLIIAAALATFLSIGFMSLVLSGYIDIYWMLPCYILLSASAAFGPVFLATMKELNPSDSAGTSLGLLNGIVYLVVALVINLAGYTMDLYKSQAVIIETAVIYPVKAYITISVGCFALSAFSLFSSFFIRETFGKCVYNNKCE